MSHYEKKIIELGSFQEASMYATYYKPNRNEYRGTILYFHGGGLIFGEREDLPEEYLDLFSKNGYGLISFDYPLSPENKLSEIVDVTLNHLQWFFDQGRKDLGIAEARCILMGRSAGAFLALKASLSAASNFDGIISLYGYYNLSDPSFTVPSRYYLQFPKVPESQIKTFIKQPPVFEGALNDRYPIYIHARQKGDWIDSLVHSKKEIKKYSIAKEQLKELPPIFIAAANGDTDVPVRQSKQIAKQAAQATTQFVDSETHDFDRTEIETNGLDVYNHIIEWLEQL